MTVSSTDQSARDYHPECVPEDYRHIPSQQDELDRQADLMLRAQTAAGHSFPGGGHVLGGGDGAGRQDAESMNSSVGDYGPSLAELPLEQAQMMLALAMQQQEEQTTRIAMEASLRSASSHRGSSGNEDEQLRLAIQMSLQETGRGGQPVPEEAAFNRAIEASLIDAERQGGDEDDPELALALALSRQEL